jgi:hypothetical protein
MYIFVYDDQYIVVKLPNHSKKGGQNLETNIQFTVL